MTDPAWGSTFRIQLGKVLINRGRNAEVVALLEPTFPPGSLKESLVKQNLLLASARQSLRQEALANQALARAEALHPEGAVEAEMVGVKGSLALDRGDLRAAEQYFQLALDLSLKGPQGSASPFLQMRMWNNLGVVAMQQEHYEDARTRLGHASSIALAHGARLVLKNSLGNLGWIYYQTGDFARALETEQTAAAQAAKVGAAQDEAQLLINVGLIQTRTGDRAPALTSCERALALAEGLQSPELMGSAHVALAYVLLGSDLPGAEGHIRQAAALAAQRKSSVEDRVEITLLEARLLSQQGNAAEAASRLLDVIQRAKDSPWVLWTAQNTLAGLYAAAGRGRDAELWYKNAIATYQRQKGEVNDIDMQLPFLENGSDLYLTYMEYLIRQRRTGDALMVLDRSRAEILAQGLHQAASGEIPRSPQPVSVSTRTLAARLNATILVYCLRPQHSYLWAINAKQEEFHELAGSEMVLPLVERHTQAILASKDLLAQKDAAGEALYEAFVKPAEALVKSGGRVFLIADKGLGGLNFETLIVPGEHPHYWIEDVAVTNARSLRLLEASGHRAMTRPAPRMLLIGDPIYRADEYAPLPNAAAEMTSIAAHFTPERRTVISGANASPATYTASGVDGFTYVHFVAHATADATNPLDSAIILSSAAGAAAPYKLYAGDILKQPLDAELVTLSSCYGSGVRNYSGEGVVGLVWAFLRAGAHSVIGAMWEVSDVSTPRLMDTMYGELLNGSKPDAALRAAKLTMVHDPGVFRKPLYWASFQLYAGR